MIEPMSSPSIHQLLPHRSSHALDDEELLALYSPSDRAVPRVRANFVSSVDGAATVAGLSGALGGPADKRVFDLLRRLSDVIVVGAGTLRAEGYGAMRLDDAAARWRLDHGMPAQPQFAIVSARLDLDPAGDVFANAPVRPIVLTGTSADPEARHELSRVAEVIDCGETGTEGERVVEVLASRGLGQVHCEGGPHLLGTLIADDVLDELCLTTSPLLEGGDGPRIAAGHADEPRPMTLDHVLVSDGMLFTKYSRTREDTPR
jgi:riboflavin biosynthesis pyrimidine reductase